eukprot:TRINITY_DN6894_c0_g1_i1.p1 TRINITY_DN6894_c0_g1~~TRINITY_DN6894_c0_g1_i1.p1  ORF type:complete len:774 (+),score=144.84 TRINITY_DN6894_c0_g1_i1:131-2323(+)
MASPITGSVESVKSKALSFWKQLETTHSETPPNINSNSNATSSTPNTPKFKVNPQVNQLQQSVSSPSSPSKRHTFSTLFLDDHNDLQNRKPKHDSMAMGANNHTAESSETTEKTPFAFWRKLDGVSPGKKSVESPSATSSSPQKVPRKEGSNAFLREYSVDEILQHNSVVSCWVSTRSRVYDFTSILLQYAKSSHLTPLQAVNELCNINTTGPLAYIIAACASHLCIGRVVNTPDLEITTQTKPHGDFPMRSEYNREQVMVHDLYNDCWIILGTRIYNITPLVSAYVKDLLIQPTEGVEDFFNQPERLLGDLIYYFAAHMYIGDLVPKIYTMEEVSEHNNERDCWVVVDTKVYNITKYLQTPDHIPFDMQMAGKNITQRLIEADIDKDSMQKLFGHRYFLGEIEVPHLSNGKQSNTSAQSTLSTSHSASSLHTNTSTISPLVSSPSTPTPSHNSNHTVPRSAIPPISFPIPIPANSEPTPGSPTLARSPSHGSPVTRQPSTLLNNRDFRAETRKIWERSVAQLPVATDIPRLAPYIDIEGRPLTPGGPKQTVSDVLLAVSNLVFGLEETRENAQILQQLHHRIPEADDQSVFSKQFPKFILEDLGDENRVVRVLKGINQAIIAPSVIELKLSMCPKLPFKDVSGGWIVHVRRRESGAVVVSHSRKQEHMDKRKEEEYFEFTWVLTMVFDGLLSSMTEITLQIENLRFGEHTTEAKKEEYTTVFKPYMTSS